MSKLYKSNQNKVFDGVCGGLGEYFNVDPVIIRLLWVLLIIFGGTGILAYVIAMIIIPKDITTINNDDEMTAGANPRFSNSFWGGLLIVVGGLTLLRVVDPVFSVFGNFMVSNLWALLLVGLGAYLIFQKTDNNDDFKKVFRDLAPGKKLYRSNDDKQIAGVCAGMGNFFELDANLIRLMWVMASLASIGFGLLGYILLAVFLPIASVSSNDDTVHDNNTNQD